MIEQLIPRNVVTVEADEEPIEAGLFPEEEALTRRAVESRRQEFATGRACAHTSLRQLGIPPRGIPSGSWGEPLWPPGVVGSITHCHGYCACAVARVEDFASVGIDAEVHEPLPRGVLESIASRRERGWAGARRLGICFDRLLFSAKEAVYKAWFPLTKRWLGFDEAELFVDPREETFRARLLVPGPVIDGRRLTEFNGRWAVQRNLILTAVVIGDA